MQEVLDAELSYIRHYGKKNNKNRIS